MVDDAHPPLHERLRAHAHHLRDTPASLQALADAHGPALQGSLLVLLAAPCALPVPGVGTVLGVAMMLMALAMWRGDAAPALPERVARVELPAPWSGRVLALLAQVYEWAGRWSRQRWQWLAQPQAWLAAKVAVMGLLIFLPIPFGNVLPSVAVGLLGLGLVFRDGLAVVGAAVAGTAALAFTAALGVGAWAWLIEPLAAWL